jgi:branched-chain amino acid aminotransferase
MSECIGKYYFDNGELTDSSKFNSIPVYEGDTIYEVLRIIDCVPLFFEDHFERLSESTRLSDKMMLAGAGELKKQIDELCRLNLIGNGNVKISFLYHPEKEISRVCFIETQYPRKEMYETGIDVVLYEAERSNPSAKVFNYRLRASVFQALVQKQAYEALLVNREDCITEGSRSNVYFIKGNIIITADDINVLGGITRKYINSICKKNGIELDLRCMPVSELGMIDSVFISGTSPHILPVRSIEKHFYNVDHSLLRQLYRDYCDVVRNYINDHR